MSRKRQLVGHEGRGDDDENSDSPVKQPHRHAHRGLRHQAVTFKSSTRTDLVIRASYTSDSQTSVARS